MKIKWGLSPRGLFNMGVYLGKAKGIFEVPGTECTLFENLTGADYTEELIKGSFDMGTCGTPPLLAALEKTEEYAVIGTAVCNCPPFYLIAGNSIEKVEDLKGKVISINKFRTCPDSVIRQLLTSANVPFASVKVVELITSPKQIEAIENKEIQAALMWEPFVSYAERVFNWHILVDCSKVILPSNYAYLIYARRALLETKPDLIRNYVTAYKNSIQYAKDNVDELLKLDYPYDYATDEDLERAIKREVPFWNTNHVFDKLIGRTAENDLKKQEVISPNFSLDSFVATI